MGVSHEDVEIVQQCVRIRLFLTNHQYSQMALQIEMVAAFAGVRLNKIPRVADIEHEV